MIAAADLTPSPWSSAQVGQACGKYHVLAQLGRGGMADVYLAVSRGPAGFNKLLVLKQLPPSRCAEADLLTMFLDEASLAARLNHPNVVQVNEVGRDGDKYFMAMEYLDGQPLVRILRRLHPNGLPLPMILRIVADACAGLHYVHTLRDFDGTPLGAVHRDVSPHNLFVTYSGHVKLVDFGIAKAAHRSTETQIGMLKGKITYMSPEQLHGSDVDGRSDVFALGIVLYEAVTRERIWGNQPQEVDILRRLVNGDVPCSPKERVPHVPDEVDYICRRALATDRDERYSSALEMQMALEAAISRLPDRVTEREIGNFVSQVFAEERQTIAAVIDQQLRALGSAPNGELTGVPTLGVDGVISVTPSRLEALRYSTIARNTSAQRRRRALFAALGALCLVGVLLSWLLLGNDERAEALSDKPVKAAVGAVKPASDLPSPAVPGAPALREAPSEPAIAVSESSAVASADVPKPKVVKRKRPKRDATPKLATTVAATSSFGPLDGRK